MATRPSNPAPVQLDHLVQDAALQVLSRAVVERVIGDWKSHHIGEYELLVRAYLKPTS